VDVGVSVALTPTLITLSIIIIEINNVKTLFIIPSFSNRVMDLDQQVAHLESTLEYPHQKSYLV